MIFAVFLSLIFSLIIPSEYYSEDMLIHLPFIKKQINSSLYQNDFLLQSINPQTNYTIYYPLMGHIVKKTTIPLKTFFNILNYCNYFLLILCLLLLSKLLTANLYSGLFTVLLLLFRIPIGGTAVQVIESELVPRAIGTTMSLWSIYFLLSRRIITAIIASIMTFFIHPLSALYIICLISMSIFIKIFKSYKKRLGIITLLLILLLGITIIIKSKFIIRTNWLTVIRLRNSYAFLDLWNIKSWGYLFTLLFPGIFLFLNKKYSSRKLNYLLLICYLTAVMLTFIHWLFAVVYPTIYIISLQLLRIWLYPVLISIFYFCYFYCKLVRRSIFLLISIFLISVLIGWRNLYVPQRKDLDKWLNVQNWAKQNTAYNCLFLVPFTSKGFRVEAERSTTGEYKDGALSFYSPDFSSEWEERAKDLSYWEEKTDADLLLLQQKYKFNYIVTNDKAKRTFQLVFNNNAYRIYSLIDQLACK